MLGEGLVAEVEVAAGAGRDDEAVIGGDGAVSERRGGDRARLEVDLVDLTEQEPCVVLLS